MKGVIILSRKKPGTGTACLYRDIFSIFPEKDLPEEHLPALFHFLDNLTPRESLVIKRRYGLGCESRTLKEVGKELKVGPERVRQIEIKALRKLRHPSTSKYILLLYTPRFELVMTVKSLETQNARLKTELCALEKRLEHVEKKHAPLSVEDLDITARSYNCLKRAGITTVDQLLETDRKVLFDTRNFGVACLENIIAALVKWGFAIPEDWLRRFDRETPKTAE